MTIWVRLRVFSQCHRIHTSAEKVVHLEPGRSQLRDHVTTILYLLSDPDRESDF